MADPLQYHSIGKRLIQPISMHCLENLKTSAVISTFHFCHEVNWLISQLIYSDPSLN